MLLPDKYTQINDSYIYKISLVIKELKNKEMFFEELHVVVRKKYNYSIEELERILIIGYAMKLINYDKGGRINVENKSIK